MGTVEMGVWHVSQVDAGDIDSDLFVDWLAYSFLEMLERDEFRQ